MKFRTASAATALVAACLAAVLRPGQPAIGQAPSPALPPESQCTALAGLELDTVEITRAQAIAEGADVPASDLNGMIGKAALVAKGLPALCRVAGHIRPEPGSDIGFEVWMPAKGWDGRFHGIGIGGFAGGIDHTTLAAAVRAGQAGMATDTGHRGAGPLGSMMDSSWAKGNPIAVRDYGSRGVHLATLAAKRLVAAYYGRGPDKSYFVGCSGGGRQGLVEASRFPGDYDGILAGAPASRLTDLVIAMANIVQAQNPEGAALSPRQLPSIKQEVVRQCDASDGQADGLIGDPRRCRPDFSKLACGASASPQCLTPPQMTALARILAGPRTSQGRQLAPGLLPAGSETGWEGFVVKTTYGHGDRTLANGVLQDYVQQPFATVDSFDFDRDPALLGAALASELDASPDLGRFYARGGKLIIWHGWADQAIPPQITLDYHAAMLRQSGARAKAQSRLFMAPGVEHCMGGSGPAMFGQMAAPPPGASPESNIVAALQAWVETGRRPESVIGTMMASGSPKPQRPICAWPKRTRLKPGSDPAMAASYSCV